MDWLQLLRTENVGPLTFYRLLSRFGTAAQALREIPSLTGRLQLPRKPLRIPSREAVEKEYAAYARLGAPLIAPWQPTYPPWLRTCPDAPPLLSVKGRLGLLKEPCFSIVGARNASLAGKKMAEMLALSLGQAGFTIVSGLARGIDTTAHLASLPTGTVAIVAGGIDQVYPPENQKLYEQLLQEGVVVSEMPLGCPPSAALFPRRNRLISGVSRGTLVVEAALKSGSLLTARYATEQGRDVFAVPGHPLDPRSSGTNKLIQEGATLVQSAQDILELYQDRSPSITSQASVEEEKPSLSLDAGTSRRVLEALSTVPLSIDHIADKLALSPALVRAALVEIEIAGYLDRHSGERVCRSPSMDLG